MRIPFFLPKKVVFLHADFLQAIFFSSAKIGFTSSTHQRVFDNMITEKPSHPSIIQVLQQSFFGKLYDPTLQLDSQVHYKMSLVSVILISLVYKKLKGPDHLFLLWKIAACYFILVVQSLLFPKTNNKQKIDYFP